MDRIYNEWTEKGFNSLKDVTFDVDIPTIKKTMKGAFDEDASLDTVAGKYMKLFNNRLAKAYNKKTGQIDGNDFMELRNQYARSANKATDNNERTVYRTLANKIDDLMLENMPAGSRKDFDVEKAAYDTSLTLDRATAKAATKKAGQFTPDEWLTSISTNRRGKGRGAQQSLATDIQQQKKAIKDAQAGKLKNLPEIKSAEDAREAVKAEFTRRKDLAAERTVRSAGKSKERLAQAKEDLKDVKFSSPQDKPSPAARVVATGQLSLPFTPFSVPASIPLGMGLANVAGKDVTQRILSGQSIDETLNALSKTNTPSGLSLADILRQGTTAGAVQQSQFE